MTETKQITSLSNPDIKRIRSLAQRKYREEDSVFLTEGLRHALEAAEAGWEFETLVIEESAKSKDLVRKLLSLIENQTTSCLEVSANVMESITKRDNAQNVVAVLRQRWANLSAIRAEDNETWIALEEIRDPGNLGTIIRTADAAGARGIILIGNTCDPYSLEAIRASMGSFPHIALVRCTREEFTAWAEKSGFQIVGTHLKATHDHRTLPYRHPLIILMGNEQAGLTEQISIVCTDLVRIPMTGKADSLNVSVATAIVLYEAQRDRLKAAHAG